MTEEGIDILRLAWADGPFSYDGKRYRLRDVDVHPKPVQPGGPPLWIAAMSEPGALRAARFGTHLLPQGNQAEVLDPYRASVRADGRDAAEQRVGIIRSFYVSDDRERDWPTIREAERFRMAVYNRFMESTPDDYGWRRPGGIPQTSFMGTAEECIAELVSFTTRYGITDIASSGLPPGVEPEFMNTNIERLATQVLPEVRSRLGRGGD
jgi:alkanesulfonate monooxygenase SsuD/methylene tetrahydromethanopterin reductase-like flavin-dependent oxidoreductase (luciferase family)